jgi:hypothetical protein
VLDDLGALAPGFLAELQARAAPARAGRLDMDQMQAVICAVCTGHYVTRAVLARLLDRSPDALRQTHISPMVRSGMLQLAFPSKPHDRRPTRTRNPGLAAETWAMPVRTRWARHRPRWPEPQRADYREVLLLGRLREAIAAPEPRHPRRRA